ncbi:MAG: HAD hydrolase family protein [Gemmatimonadaceae bacterium]|nr:HAD hydrolase family protein [Gemmatimonadaceae bacterium]
METHPDPDHAPSDGPNMVSLRPSSTALDELRRPPRHSCTDDPPALAKRIALVAFDVDGTLTDNGVYIGDSNSAVADERIELKRYDIQDGLGIVMLKHGRRSSRWRSSRDGVRYHHVAGKGTAGVTHLKQGRGLKKVPVLRALKDLGIPFDAMAFMGDDLADIAVMQRVAISAAPGNAAPEATAAATIHAAAERGPRCGPRVHRSAAPCAR